MEVKTTAAKAAKELSAALESIEEESINKLIEAVISAKKIYVAGAGRSLLMLRALAMRLMHLGFCAYVTGDTTTPAFEEGDLMIIASGSGETSGLVYIADKVRNYKGTLAVLTIRGESTLGKMADICVVIPAFTDKVDDPASKRPILPGASMFEESVLLLGDTLVLPLAEKMNIPTDRLFKRHANLE